MWFSVDNVSVIYEDTAMSHRIYESPTHDEQSLKAKPTRAPFGYFGAKQTIARRIIETFPEHNAWVEGFCGSAALTLAKKPVPIEVINDIDKQIVNLFSQLRENSDALCRAVELTPYARDEFVLARDHTTNGASADVEPVEQARRFLVATMMTVNGTMNAGSGWSYSQSYARQGREARVNRWCNLPRRIEKAVERLRGVRVENRDAREIVEMFEDRPATLVYLDPPYYTKRKHTYVIDAQDAAFHQDLLKKCTTARCMLVISGYQNELYEEILTPDIGWERRSIGTSTRDTTGKIYSRTEVLWMNSVFLEAKKNESLPLTLTQQEIEQNKVNPPRKI